MYIVPTHAKCPCTCIKTSICLFNAAALPNDITAAYNTSNNARKPARSHLHFTSFLPITYSLAGYNVTFSQRDGGKRRQEDCVARNCTYVMM